MFLASEMSGNFFIRDFPISYLLSFLRVFENGEVSFRGLFSGPVTTFESNIPYTLRFMIDTKARP